ncbi:hypothetical protein LSTR_LSTR014249 [Laodelphax striatellus]|uniref:Uncharacterized protein n=1 Tax=Laodelphax striatellus TaxID=195883 RepID=A0A482WDM7_LAOST|nr:hypothetical protein LSTR_LSTR014249 [Laodelphax striatellus]
MSNATTVAPDATSAAPDATTAADIAREIFDTPVATTAADIAREIFDTGRVFKPVAMDKLKNIPKGIPLNVRYVRCMTTACGEGILAELEREYDYARCFMHSPYINTVFKNVGKDPVDMTGFSVIVHDAKNNSLTLEFFKNGVPLPQKM